MVGAPYKDVYKKNELTPEGIAKRAKLTVDFWKGMVLCQLA
jgi:transketolase